MSVRLKGNVNAAIAPLRLDREATSTTLTGNRPAGIQGNGGKGLQQLVRIGYDWGEALIKLPLDDDLAEIGLIG
jgi:hypothetical protein